MKNVLMQGPPIDEQLSTLFSHDTYGKPVGTGHSQKDCITQESITDV